MPTLCLNMIVKNESMTIRRMFDSIKPYIDYWVICDTGSTDGTQDIIEEFKKEVPGELHEIPWVDFGTCRSRAIELANGKADYIILSDADHTLVVNDTSFKEKLSADIYSLQMLGGITYYLPRIVKSGINWRFVGKTHEYIHSDDSTVSGKLEDIAFADYYDGGCRHEKFPRDLQLLQDSAIEDPTNPRTIFYLANTYRDMGRLVEARDAYKKRVDLGGWEEEVWDSMYHIAIINEQLGEEEGVVVKSYMDTFEFNPIRMEPLWQLTKYHRERKSYAKAYTYGTLAHRIKMPTNVMLFVDREAYRWKIFDEMSIASYWVGDYVTSMEMHRILEINGYPENQKQRIQANRQFAEAKVTIK